MSIITLGTSPSSDWKAAAMSSTSLGVNSDSLSAMLSGAWSVLRVIGVKSADVSDMNQYTEYRFERCRWREILPVAYDSTFSQLMLQLRIFGDEEVKGSDRKTAFSYALRCLGSHHGRGARTHEMHTS